jgi:hypothetical protein
MQSSVLYPDEPKLHYCTEELEVLMEQRPAFLTIMEISTNMQLALFCSPILSFVTTNDDDVQLLQVA